MREQGTLATRWGLVCLSIVLMLGSLSLPLHCVRLAVLSGGIMLLDGLLLGGALAAVTRTRRPLLIYLWLGVAALSLWWLIVFQLPGEAESVQLWQGAPSLLKNYFDILRVGVFLAGIPYPFIRIGHHAPDIPPDL